MQVYGIIGWKNAGKTGLMERLVAEITRRGFTVSTVKHVHHDVDLDQPGKDTYRHRAAGAAEVVLASAHRFALMREHRGAEPDLAEVLARLAPVDLVLVEGYKRDSHRKIEVFRAETGHTLIQPGDPLVRAVATDAALPPLPVPVLDLNDAVAVARFILADCGLAKRAPGAFDTVVVVDWSASTTPSPGRPSADAIWIGCARADGETASYHRTRADAERHLTELLATEAAAGRRVLAGFDFPLGYPEGAAQAITGQVADPQQPRAFALWDWLAERVQDGPANANNRFALAEAINARFAAPGPFWGRPAGLALPHLPDRKTADYPALGLTERRRVETVIPRASPVWKLYTTGSVGSQALMGLPMLARLRQRFGPRVWPFEAPEGPLVLAEIYPSLIDPAVARAVAQGMIKDAAQVRLLACALLRLSQRGTLPRLLAAVPDWPGRSDEGWILGAGHAALLLEALA
ncbi:molybdopterin-guanine dinucleotide biosynthesis protein B [Fertoebacter nigrum]|uniref:Molybdopterin-guanine dinucleotide biosynthesis protein B n=1 Tax=Fertoeibacter niger TaxID=2656921 RepID=A0A8X8H219_9RHOB|nr:molybdopterin-guanine dinucleotide biosynthesis protein B [Fertoeibacter niger]NUB44747.1 molybdopterin-guanine dinucleotide biosynthesis protein B [Fertoeibacter niger]